MLMLKKNLFPRQISDLFLLIVAAIILVIFYNFKTIESELLLSLDPKSFATLSLFILKIFSVISVTIIFFLALSFNRILLKTFLILNLFISSGYFYVLNKFGTILDGAMIANALDSVGHADEVVDYSLAIYFLCLALLPAIAISKLKITSTSWRVKSITATLFALFLVGAHLVSSKEKALKISFSQYSPPSYAISIYEYFERFHGELAQGRERQPLTDFYKFSRAKNPQNFNVVLIIGESLRADHLSLNGYARETSPRLEKIHGLLNYTIDASFNTTTRSVTSMLSHRSRKDFADIPPEKSVVNLFKELGFKTSWYSAQSSKEFHNGMLNIMAAEADDYFFRDRLQSANKSNKIYDEALIPYLQSAIKNGGNNFVVLHSFGSHIRFHERYPENFKVFTPECLALPASCPQENVSNSYDNSVIYTDYFVSRVIESLQGSKSILFFASDHGSFLGEGGVYANGGGEDAKSDSVKKVPMFFYMTDELKRDEFFRRKFLTASKKTHSKNLSHDNLFDSLLDCSGVESDLFKRNLSICRKRN